MFIEPGLRHHQAAKDPNSCIQLQHELKKKKIQNVLHCVGKENYSYLNIYTYNLREKIIYQSSQRRISKLASVRVPVGEHLNQMGHQVITDYLKQ